MGYWVQMPHGDRKFCATLKDAYSDAAKILLGQYRYTNGNIHRTVEGYHGSTGIKIFNSRTGKSYTHAVRFDNGSDPKNGYEELAWNKMGMSSKGKMFPKNW